MFSFLYKKKEKQNYSQKKTICKIYQERPFFNHRDLFRLFGNTWSRYSNTISLVCLEIIYVAAPTITPTSTRQYLHTKCSESFLTSHSVHYKTINSATSYIVSLHLAEKHFPENHLPEKHFSERSFSRINICQKSHLPEWTVGQWLKFFLQNFDLPAMAWDEFFIMYEEFQNNFWKFYKKFPHQPNFLTPLAQNFGVFGLWCTTATICKLKHPLGVWAL